MTKKVILGTQTKRSGQAYNWCGEVVWQGNPEITLAYTYFSKLNINNVLFHSQKWFGQEFIVTTFLRGRK
jgi:hypothetical protein